MQIGLRRREICAIAWQALGALRWHATLTGRDRLIRITVTRSECSTPETSRRTGSYERDTTRTALPSDPDQPRNT